VLIPFLLGNLPTVGGDVDLVSRVQGVIDMLLEDRAGFSLAGSLIFIWVATRLVGTLRTALREVFDFSHGRGIVRGKLFDAFMVVVGGVLFTVNVGITVLVEAVESYGVNLIGLEGTGLSTFRQVSAQALAFGFIWALFLLIYRYLPPRRIPWRTALTAATFTGVLFEATKYLFSWYVTNAANFTTVYGGLTSAAILFFWIYYGAVVFILGGEVAQVSTMSRIRRLHAENALPNGAASG
jgi:membrane protein